MATSETTQPLTEEITSSLCAVWKRYSTKRPTQASTEIEGNVVRCVLPASVHDFESGMAEGEGGDDLAGRRVTYRREATAAVARSARCRVLALISEHDAETDIATETFLLDIAPRQARFGEPGWIAR